MIDAALLLRHASYMSDTLTPRCCGRDMNSIAVEQGSSSVVLHSCPSCGSHVWASGGVQVDRPALLDALRTEPSAKPRRRPAAAAPRVKAETSRREELQRMLAEFQVHGTTS